MESTAFYQNLPQTITIQERMLQVQSLRRVARSLGLPYYTTCTALYLYHRYTAVHSISNWDIVLTGCLSLGMKIEETVRKLVDIYSSVQQGLHNMVVELDPKVLESNLIE